MDSKDCLENSDPQLPAAPPSTPSSETSDEEYEEIDSSNYSGAQPLHPTPPPLTLTPPMTRSSSTPDVRVEEKNKEYKRFRELAKANVEKCLLCTTSTACTAIMHMREPDLPTYHFVYCKRCARIMLWKLTRCPICKKQIDSTRTSLECSSV